LNTDRFNRRAPITREKPPTRTAMARKREIRRNRVEKYTAAFTINAAAGGVK
jgi:hypothetical protein